MKPAYPYVESAYDWLFPRRAYVCCLFLALVMLPLSGLSLLQFSMDYRTFFGGENDYLEEYEKQQNTYSRNDSVLLAIEPLGGTVFDYELLKTLQRFTHLAWQVPGVTRVDSLTNFQDSFASSNEMVVRDLVSEEVDFSGALIKYIEKVSLEEPALVNRLVSEDGRYTGLALTVQLPDGPEKNEKILEVAREARALARELEREPLVKKVYLSGTVMINNAFYEVSKRDLLTLIPIMFLVIVLFMAVLLRSVSWSIIIFMKVGLAVGISFGLGAAIGIQLTPPAVAAAPIIMMLSIADSVHLLTLYRKFFRAGDTTGDRRQSMKKSLVANFSPVTLTSITTIIGFSTMNFSESPPFHDLGNLVVLGAVAGYLLTVIVIPILIPSFKVPIGAENSLIEDTLQNLGSWVIVHRARLVICTLALTAALSLFISNNELNDEFVRYFDKSVTFRTDNDFITENLTGVYQIEYSLSSQGVGAINDPEYLMVVDRFAQWFRQQKHVVHVQSVSDIYKKAHMNLLNGAISEYRIPETRAVAAQALLAYELSLPAGLDLNDQINISKSESKFVVSLRSISAKELIEIEQGATRWLTANAPSYMASAIGTGPAVLFSHIGMRSIKTGLIGGGLALLLICLLVAIAFRSVKLGVISAVPNLLPAAMAFGVWGLINGQINMALATVLSMTLGIIADDTIHFISKYQKSREEGLAAEDAVKATFSSVGVAICVTSFVLVAGFSVLTVSPFVMNWGMGLLSAITIIFALATDLVLLPAFLIQFERSKRDELVTSDSSGL